MKLINKETGEIGRIAKTKTDADEIEIITDTKVYLYKSISEVCKHWEDYEEPKDFWYIDDECGIMCDSTDPNLWDKKYAIEFMQQIGNYFNTREEAEKAVEKLKAWKRLKDKGFRFTGVAGILNNIYVSFETDSKYRCGHVMYDEYTNTDNKLKEYNEDLDLLFGGEE